MSALRKVLVVDDDPVVGKSFARVLSGKGYAVITASNGQEALSKLDAEDYDVVFTDIKMPGMNGIEVAERVKQKRPWLPVVIVTGYGSAENETRAEAAGVSGFLHKPLSPEMIEGTAQKAMLERDAGAAAASQTEAAPQPAPAPEPPASFGRILKNVALFFAAPFVGLAYILAFPIVGLGMLIWMGAQAVAKRNQPNKIGRIQGHASAAAPGRVEAAPQTTPGAQAAARQSQPKKIGLIAKNVGLFIVSPFIGLVYVLLFPFIGLAMLVWIGIRASVKRSGPV